MNVLVTGSSGLIGSEAVAHFDGAGHAIYGFDNNMRAQFFGASGDTTWNLRRLHSASVLECIDLIDRLSGHKVHWSYRDENRIGDHICCISNLTKLRSHYPEWSITATLDAIVREMVAAEEKRHLAAISA